MAVGLPWGQKLLSWGGGDLLWDTIMGIIVPLLILLELSAAFVTFSHGILLDQWVGNIVFQWF